MEALNESHPPMPFSRWPMTGRALVLATLVSSVGSGAHAQSALENLERTYQSRCNATQVAANERLASLCDQARKELEANGRLRPSGDRSATGKDDWSKLLACNQAHSACLAQCRTDASCIMRCQSASNACTAETAVRDGDERSQNYQFLREVNRQLEAMSESLRRASGK